MIKNYLKVAFRNLQRNKLVSFINIFGLGLSMTIGLMVMIRLQDAFSYDLFHANAARIVRINSKYDKKAGGEQWKMASTPLPLYEKLLENPGSFEKLVSIYPAFRGKASAAGKEMYINGAFTESSFFDVFGFQLAAGSAPGILNKPNTVVISAATAEKFFGSQDAIGKVFAMDNGSSFIVSGVMKPFPGKSHLNYDAYASYSTVAAMEKNKLLPPRLNDWFAFNTSYTYGLLQKGQTAANANNELKNISAALNRINQQGVSAFSVQALASITPGNERLYNDNSGSSWGKFYFEIGIAFIILLAACFNYTNLTTARALTRAKEVGIRKVTGATRGKIFLQYIIESTLLSFLALGFAWVVLAFIIQYAPFNDGYEFISSSFEYNLPIAGWSVAFALFTGLLAGTAPAWILSSFKPVRVLKNLSTAKLFGKISIQKTLIVFQYSLSLTIIIFLFAFYQQFAHLAKVDPGFKRDNILVLPLNGLDENIVSQQLGAVSGVRSVSAVSYLFGGHFNGITNPVWTTSKADAVAVGNVFASANFITDMNIQLLAGNNFPRGGSAAEKYILLNERAAFALGLKDYSKAVGQSVWVNDSLQLEVLGIVKNFNYENAALPVGALAIRNKQNSAAYIFIATEAAAQTAVRERVLAAAKTIAPKQALSVSWLHEDLENGYSQTATLSLLGYIAFMVVAIATLGLTGLVIYTVEVKRKEISMRKILGAERKQIVQLLSTGFVKLLFIAGCIAVPIGYTAGYLFLQNFPNRSGFGVYNAIACFVLLLLIGLVTILTQTWRAASANPVKDLRLE